MFEADIRDVKNKCVLEFKCNFKYKEILINETITAVRQFNESLASMETHIVNKIAYYMEKVIKSEDVSEARKSMNIVFYRNQQPLHYATNLGAILLRRGDYTMQLMGKQYIIFVNRPYIAKLSLPEQIYVGMPVVYTMIDHKFLTLKNTRWAWYVSDNKKNWTIASKHSKFTPTEEQVGKFVKCRIIPQNEYSSGKAVECISECVITRLDDVTLDAFTKRHKLTSSFLSGKEIRVVSYNILADMYVDESRFPYVDNKYSNIDYRKKLVIKEILGYHADIICLQEVDLVSYKSYFKAQLEENGYGVIYCRKGNRLKEGLLTAYRRSRFELITNQHYVFSLTVKEKSDFMSVLNSDKAIKAHFLKLPTTLQTSILKLKDTDETFVVANTHLYYHKDADKIRMIQVLLALNILKKQKLPLLFLGDFNSLPHSSTYKLLSTGQIKTDDFEFDYMLESVLLKFNFGNACGTPKFTNYVHSFNGCLDYIFYEKDKFTCLRTLEIPSEEEITENVAIPSKKYPSDHIALVADIQIN